MPGLNLIGCIRENCVDERGCQTSSCTNECRIDRLAEDWVRARHTEAFYIGEATRAEWDAAYEHAVKEVAQ